MNFMSHNLPPPSAALSTGKRRPQRKRQTILKSILTDAQHDPCSSMVALPF